jgi:hypothetical protein
LSIEGGHGIFSSYRELYYIYKTCLRFAPAHVLIITRCIRLCLSEAFFKLCQLRSRIDLPRSTLKSIYLFTQAGRPRPPRVQLFDAISIVIDFPEMRQWWNSDFRLGGPYRRLLFGAPATPAQKPSITFHKLESSAAKPALRLNLKYLHVAEVIQFQLLLTHFGSSRYLYLNILYVLEK